MAKQIIAQGAEALLTRKNSIVIKDRIKKFYRLPFLDEKLRKQRTKKEIKLLEKASKLIPVPKIIKTADCQISLEFIKGKKLSEFLDDLADNIKACKMIGINIARLHDEDIIHGDLTTSNMIYVKSRKNNNSNGRVFFIDFGLGFESSRIEDKATDLHVLKEALEARHFSHSKDFYKAVLEGYKSSKNSQLVLNQLKKVELRGRYKAQY